MITRRPIPVDQLAIDPMQSRDHPWTNDEADRQLARSIDDIGLLQDLIVRPQEHRASDDGVNGGNRYTIIAGARRFHAAMDAGYEAVPCKIFEAEDLDAAWTSLHENTDRMELSEQEIAHQLRVIYELVRPESDPHSCPDCGTAVEGETSLHNHYAKTDCSPRPLPHEAADTDRTPIDPDRERFETTRQAKRYLAHRFLGRTDRGGIKIIRGHLRTAQLPDPLQALFKQPAERTDTEQTALQNYSIDTRTTLGSGDGHSGAAREIVSLYETVAADLAEGAVDPTDAVLETVGSLQHEEMSEQEFRRSVRDFRQDLTADLDASLSAAEQRQRFTETLQTHMADLRSTYEKVEPTRPFKRVDVLGPETQQHSRWHARAMTVRDASGHGDLVRQLYHERLESLAAEEGWD